MTLSTRRMLLWIAANIVALLAMPLVMAFWSERLVAGDDASLPQGFSTSTFVIAFTAAWVAFLVLLNVSVLLFVWLSRRTEK